jgi:ABC-2 type transport system ATP-binding protein
LATIANHAFTALSGGQIRLVGIAQALLGDPTLLLLDEVTRGLDVEDRERVFRHLRRLASHSLIIFSTHIPEHVAHVADRVVLLNEGRVCYAGETEALRRRAKGRVHMIQLPQNTPANEIHDYQVSRRVEYEGWTELRVLGRAPSRHAAVEVEPTLEDAYLLLLERNRS